MTATMGFTARIVPELEPLARPLTDAIRHPDNARQHRLDKIAKSLTKHGQRSPIIVQISTNYIVKGNGTHEAAEMLGWETLAMVFQEMDDSEAYGYLLDDNKASDESTYDKEKLHSLLERMVDGPGLGESLWELEEFADLDESINGAVTLAPAPTGAAYINDAEIDAAKQEARAATEKMRELPLMMTAVSYPVFLEWVKALQKAYGAGGSADTIIEAVRRQYELEVHGAAQTGKNASQRQLDHAVKLTLSDIAQIARDKWGGHENIPAAGLMDLLRSMMPKAEVEAPAVVPGQTEAFPESAAGNSSEPSEDGHTVDAAAGSESASPQEPEGEELASAVADSSDPATDAIPEPTGEGESAVAPEAGVTDSELEAEFAAYEAGGWNEVTEALARDEEPDIGHLPGPSAMLVTPEANAKDLHERPEAFQEAILSEFELGGSE